MRSFYEDVIRILRKNGFHIVSKQGKGSHESWSNGRIKVIVPYNCYSKFTANGIIKKAGINHKF